VVHMIGRMSEYDIFYATYDHAFDPAQCHSAHSARGTSCFN